MRDVTPNKKTPYVTPHHTSPVTCHELSHQVKTKIKMLCNKCCRFREELRKASNNIRLVELLLEDARKMEDSQDRLDRLAMLHKHARTNYQDVANLNYVIDNCEDHPRCSNRWTTRAKFTSNCPQSVTEIKTPPHPEVPSSTERDTKNTDDDNGSAYRSLYHVLTHLWNVSTIYSTVILSTCPDNRSKIKT